MTSRAITNLPYQSVLAVLYGIKCEISYQYMLDCVCHVIIFQVVRKKSQVMSNNSDGLVSSSGYPYLVLPVKASCQVAIPGAGSGPSKRWRAQPAVEAWGTVVRCY
jgi:hypothetical protein